MNEETLLTAMRRWTAACAALTDAAHRPTIEWMTAFGEFRDAGDAYADALRREGFAGGI